MTGIPNAEMIYCELDYAEALAEHARVKGEFPNMSNEALTRSYPGQYQSLLQIIHTTGERIEKRTAEQ